MPRACWGGRHTTATMALSHDRLALASHPAQLRDTFTGEPPSALAGWGSAKTSRARILAEDLRERRILSTDLRHFRRHAGKSTQPCNDLRKPGET